MRIVALLTASLASFAFAAESLALGDVLEGVATSDWSGIRAAYEAGRHRIQRQEDGTLAARNPGQQWLAEFDGKGFTVTPDHGKWTWGLELTGYGERTFRSDEPPGDRNVPAPNFEGGKITCQRDENLTEWFINDTRGLEQGWTLHSKDVAVSSASGEVTLTLAVRGGLSPQVSDDGSSVSFRNESGGDALTYGGLKAWDADGKILPVRFELADQEHVSITVEDENALYPITIDPIAQQAYLKASNPGADDEFGFAVAISGDTVVVGAVGEDGGNAGANSTPNEAAIRAGAAYVFVRNGTAWTQQAYLKASNPGVDDFFGRSVGISGDTIIVGAHNEASTTTGVNSTPNDNALYAGAAYVFVRDGSTWTQQAYLKSGNTRAGDRFGFAVAISGDSVAVGAFGESSGTTGVNSTPSYTAGSSGAAYVFTRSGTTWSQQAYLKASNTGASDEFGRAIAISGDTLVVGAWNEDSGSTGVNSTPNEGVSNAGAAYIFSRTGGSWAEQAYLKASDSRLANQFGGAVGTSGDIVAVGAHREGSLSAGVNSQPVYGSTTATAGAAYVFSRVGSIWAQQAYLKPSNPGSSDQFGTSVAVAGEMVLVGAPQESSGTTGVNSAPDESAGASGSAYLFTRVASTWFQRAYLKPSNTQAGDRFGTSAAASTDAVIVGAPLEDSGTTGVDSVPNESSLDSGAAYVFSVPAQEIVVEQPVLSDLADNVATLAFGSPVVGMSSGPKIFTVRNAGLLSLRLDGISVDGADAGDFTVDTAGLLTSLGPDDSTTFRVTFTPGGSAPRSAVLHISSNDGDESSFDIALTGSILSYSVDTDGDGLSDASESLMHLLGYDWQVSQPALVNIYNSNPNAPEVYTAAQVQALHPGTPLISRNPATGKFKLTMDWKKSTNLADFFDFPAPAGSSVLINSVGDIEFEFPNPDNAAFFRIEEE